jgi:hypothetical protein
MRPDDTQWYGTVRKMLIVALACRSGSEVGLNPF